MSASKKILVTSALPYANGPIHLGHLAGAYLPADIFVRYQRLKQSDVVFICGSDEHGVPILLRARAENTSPKAVVDVYHEMNKNSFRKFGIDFDYYGRTSSPTHYRTSQDMFRVLAEKGVFILKSDRQLYDPEAEMFLADRFVKGTCPSCGFTEAYGDQCEKCGISLSPTDLIDPRSAITQARPVEKESVHWYLPLAASQPDLEKWIAGHPEWKPNVLGQVRSWLAEGLKDRAVTRDLSWGVPIPEDIARQAQVDASGKVLYVWFDAPIGYISATKEWAAQTGKPERWRDYWQNEETRLIHFIGKDNIVFHCLIFPAMLMAHGDYVLPENVPANEFLNLEGDKLSTSRNYAVWLDDYLQTFEPDPLRYCLASILPETRDADFSWRDFQARHNNELADVLGNFINRTLTFIDKHFEGTMPEKAALTAGDEQLRKKLQKTPQKVGQSIDSFQIRQGLRLAMDLARYANKYFNDQEPWRTIKTDRPRCATTLALCVDTIDTLSVVLEPYIPFTAHKIRALLNVPPTDIHWDRAGKPAIAAGHRFNKPAILFSKIEDHVIEKELKKLKENIPVPGEESKDRPPTVSIEEFNKLDLRVAEILSAEKVAKTDKLMKLRIRVGGEERQIVAGIAGHYQAETLPGRQIVIVANLQPATIRNEKSEGMLLAAKNGDQLTLIMPSEAIPPGAKIS